MVAWNKHEAQQVLINAGNHNIQLLAEQALTFRPKLVVVADEAGYKELNAELSGSKIEVAAGNRALTEAANLDSDIVMAGIVGIAGLEPTMAAVKRGVTVALANKESLVCAGTILINEIECTNMSSHISLQTIKKNQYFSLDYI